MNGQDYRSTQESHAAYFSQAEAVADLNARAAQPALKTHQHDWKANSMIAVLDSFNRYWLSLETPRPEPGA
jgi:hypothetical protein